MLFRSVNWPVAAVLAADEDFYPEQWRSAVVGCEIELLGRSQHHSNYSTSGVCYSTRNEDGHWKPENQLQRELGVNSLSAYLCKVSKHKAMRT